MQHPEAYLANCTARAGGQDDEATCAACVDTKEVRGVCAHNRVLEDADRVLINLRETYMGKEVWEPEITRLPCADAVDHATCIAGVANRRNTNGCHAHVQDFPLVVYKGVQSCGL
jgi:hypothetical protein